MRVPEESGSGAPADLPSAHPLPDLQKLTHITRVIPLEAQIYRPPGWFVLDYRSMRATSHEGDDRAKQTC